MSTSSPRSAAEIFEIALESDPAERAASVRRACGENHELYAEVMSLLEADERAGEFLHPPSKDFQDDQNADLLLNTWIGHYHIERVIAVGGMGAVYEAVQDEPKRTVALKVVRAGMGSASAVQRFKHEAQILGRLRHPCIAQIYEAGTEGQNESLPFFAMEHVVGARRITQYAAERQLSTRQRLELFLKVCDAVHYGHQRGVVHRDLKPGNILVDEAGQPKVIDFGVARITDADTTVLTTRTAEGQILGTLRYMSPEQCAGDPAEIDIRCDVYALGVVLFELLTGEMPYDFKTPSPFDVPRIIREEEPRRLSVFNRMLRGDLETIVRKALEKDRDRRYQSVAQLAQDIRRFMNHEPIEARRTTGWYVLRKIVRRHRGTAAALCAFVLLLGGFGAAMFVLYHRSEMQAQTAQQVVDVLQRTLTQADPYASEGSEALRALLDRTAEQLQKGQVKDPKVRAAVHRTLGATYTNLGHYDEGGRHLRAAYEAYRTIFGDDHVETADSLSRYAVWQYISGDYATAESSLRAAIPILELHEAERRGELGRSYGRLAVVLLYQRRPAEGEVAAREFLRLAEKNPEDPDGNIATAASLISTMLQAQGRLTDAEPFLRESLERDQALYGENHPRISRDLHNLAILLRKTGKYDDAVAAMQDAIRIDRRTLADDAPGHVYNLQDLAHILADKGDQAAAREMQFEAVEMAKRVLEDDNPQKAVVFANAADFLFRTDETAAALELARRAETIAGEALPPGHPDVPLYRALCGRCLLELEQYEEAEADLRGSFEELRDAFGVNDGRTQEALVGLVELYRQTQRPGEREKFEALMTGDVQP